MQPAVKKRLQALMAELGAIVLWNRTYLDSTERPDEIDRAAYAARQERLQVIANEIRDIEASIHKADRDNQGLWEPRAASATFGSDALAQWCALPVCGTEKSHHATRKNRSARPVIKLRAGLTKTGGSTTPARDF